jgi:hypothetical protein
VSVVSAGGDGSCFFRRVPTTRAVATPAASSAMTMAMMRISITPSVSPGDRRDAAPPLLRRYFSRWLITFETPSPCMDTP